MVKGVHSALMTFEKNQGRLEKAMPLSWEKAKDITEQQDWRKDVMVLLRI